MTATHIESLDSLRAIAIISVLFVHAGTPGFEAGWIGVDLFFALSGFLITTLLLTENNQTNHISYKDFLKRRSLRLMPAYIIYISIVTYGIWILPDSVRTENSGWTALDFTMSLWFYFVNLAPMGGIWNGQEITVHLWSLAVEQQYYVIWPLIVIIFSKKPNLLLLSGLILSVLSALMFFFTPEGLFKISGLPTRGFTLVLSSTLAIAAYQYKKLLPKLSWFSIHATGFSIILSALALSAFHIWNEQEVRQYLLIPMSTYFSFLVLYLWYFPLNSHLTPYILNPIMVYLGKISYGMYLYHELIRFSIWHFGKPLMIDWPIQLGYVTRLILYVLATVAVASMSYHYIEQPFLKLRNLFRFKQDAH